MSGGGRVSHRGADGAVKRLAFAIALTFKTLLLRRLPQKRVERRERTITCPVHGSTMYRAGYGEWFCDGCYGAP